LTGVASTQTDDGPAVALILESVGDFLGGDAESSLTALVRLFRRNDHCVIAEAESTTWTMPWPLLGEFRNGRRGLVLQPDQGDGDTLFRTGFPNVKRADYPPGRGIYVAAGMTWTAQMPMAPTQ
jgi:DNA segregation ATPase FtsK/SpoIIIE, S-DNA-T family